MMDNSLYLSSQNQIHYTYQTKPELFNSFDKLALALSGGQCKPLRNFALITVTLLFQNDIRTITGVKKGDCAIVALEFPWHNRYSQDHCY